MGVSARSKRAGELIHASADKVNSRCLHKSIKCVYQLREGIRRDEMAAQIEKPPITTDALREALKADGWHIETEGYTWKQSGVDWWAWKVFDGFPDCTSNEKPPHVAFLPWVVASDGHTFRSVQFTVTGEVRDRWVEFQVYSVQMDDALEALPRAVNILRAAWVAAASV